MDKVRILVVEDESIVAKDIQQTLIRLGYDVPATASSAPNAFAKLEEYDPDLVFLDIKLKGEQDGIHVAEHIRQKYDIPVIFLTSFVDKNTLDRAKVTEPYGYLVKPFNESDLQTTVEMALYKFKKDLQSRENEKRFANALTNVEDAILVTDMECRVSFLNPKAESITGFGNVSAQGMNLFKLIKLESDEYEIVNTDSLAKHMKQGDVLDIPECTITVLRDYSNIKASFVCSPIRDEKDHLLGYAIVITKADTPAKKTNTEVQPTVTPESKPAETASNPLENQVIQNSFFVKRGSMLVKVFLENIYWLQAMDNYVIIQTKEDQFVIHATMKDIETKLPSDKFLRIHRSYIIALDKISAMDEGAVVIKEKTIPVGKSYKEVFMNRINFL
ncbi:MAG TPA: response regulator [Bacteroidia bacterium]|nr:response regulator [Bacteroidota bacterium]MCB8930902.1 response regulator [Bacteroidia bacterium]MCB0848229.1 response regulator [Bacteroidota bacterium]MCW5931431.1 response regulator [Bacteroidota bacterium]HNR48795.1 response regulator [Bacteroidia bacterium]